MRKKFLLTMFSLVLFAFCGTSLHATDGNVAKVGNTEYATIDEAIANWTSGSTLTLLADVALSDVIQLSSTEHHILDLGTYTMTAASRKDAIQIVNNGRSSASYALDIKADAENPGGITASGKAVVKTTGKSGVQDRPIIRFYNGVFTGTNVVYHSGSNGTNCPQFWFYGGEFNGTVYANRALFQFYGGTFNGALQISVDSSAYALVSGGRFKKLSNQYGSSLNSGKFTIGSAKGNYNRGIYVDAEGYYVITSEVITEVSAKYPAVKKESYNSNNYFYYSAAATYGMFYEVASMAGTGSNVTIWVKPAVTIPETLTGDVVDEIKNNTALKDYTPENLPEGAELEIVLVSVGETFVYDVTPMANDTEVEPTEAITFRLPVPASVTETLAKVYHEGTSIGIYTIQGTGNAKYVEVSSADFSEFAVEPIVPAAKIGTTAYETLSAAFAAVTDDNQTVVICKDVTENLTSTLRGNITTENNAKVTITLTNSDWVYCPYTFVVGENITLNVPALFYYAAGTQINGTVVAGAYYQRYGSTKLTINEPGSMTVTSETCIIRYMDGDPNAGIYVVGDNNDETVGLKLSVAYFYQGMINAKDANIVAGTYWQTNETDGQGSANLVLDNSTLTVTVYDHPAKATGNSTVTLTNGSVLDARNGGFTYDEANATLSVDKTSKIIGKNGALVELPVAKIGTTKYTSLQAAINAAAEGATITMISDCELTAQNAQELFKPAYNRESYCGISIPDDKAIVLDLNGSTVSYVDAYGDVDNVMVLNLGNLTINDSQGGGKLTYKPVAGTSQYSKFYSTIFNCGTVTVNGGTVENTCETATDVTNAVDNHSRLSHEYSNDCVLTVNGGTLTGSEYYSIRQYTHYLEGVKNRVVINGGTFNNGIYMQHGESWYYANPSANRLNVDCGLTINGGTFNTNYEGASCVVSRLSNPDNNAWNIEINGGTFNAPIKLRVQRGVYYANGVSGTTVPAEATGARNTEWLEKNGGFVKGGTFADLGSEDDVTSDLVSFLAAGYKFEATSEGKFGVVVDPAYGKVAKIGNDYYETLAAAVDAAQENDEVVIFRADTYALKVKNNVTITGAVAGVEFANIAAFGCNGANVTFNNVTFTYANNSTYKGLQHSGNLVYNNCTFNGQVFLYGASETFNNCTFNTTDSNNYNVWTYGAKKVAFNECTFNSAGKSVLIYAESATVFNDVTVTACTFIASTAVDGKAAIEMDSSLTGGINLTIDAATTATGFGEGNVSGNSLWNNKKGNADAANNDITVKVGDDVVLAPIYEAQIGEVKYRKLADAFAAAQVGDVVKVFAGTYAMPSMKAGITIEGQGNVLFEGTLSGTLENLTMKNIQIKGGNAQRWAYAKGNLLFENVTFEATSVYALHFDGITAGTNLTYKNCTIIGWAALGGSPASCTFEGCTIKGNGTYGLIRTYFNTTIKDCTFDVANVNTTDTYQDGIHAVEGAQVVVENCTNANGDMKDLVNVHATSVVTVDGVAIKNLAKVGNNYYLTLQDAFAAVGGGAVVIELLDNATLNYGAREAYGTAETTSLTINGNGKVLTLNQTNSDWSSFGLANAEAKVVFNNMTIEKTGKGDTSGAWNTHAIIFSSNVEMNEVTVNNAIAVQDGATLNNVTINEANGYYGLWINGNGQTVTMNGGSITATNGGRGIKIADQYIDNPAQVTLNVTGTAFTTAKKAAVLVSSKAGAEIAASNVNIENVAEDKVNFVWVDEDWAANYGNVEVTGATVAQEGIGDFVAAIKKGNEVQAYYKDLHAAMVAAKAGETVVLIADVDLAGTEWEPVSFGGTFDGNGKTISNLTINKPGVSNTGFIKSLNGTVKNVTFTSPTVKGGENTAVVAGRAGGSAALAENITINGTIKVETTHSGYARAAAIVGGWAYGNYKNITVDGGDKANSYIKHTGGGDGRYVAGIVGHADDVNSYVNCTVKNITISGGWLCGGIAGPGPADKSAIDCSVENINMHADYSGGMFGWYYGAGTIENATIKNVTFTDGSTNNGVVGGYGHNTDATVTNLTFENVQNSDGKPLLDHVASIGDNHYFTLADAVSAADNNATINLIWKEGKAPIAMNASLYGKSVTISGTAKVDWSKGFLFVGRGGEGDATLTFDNANLTSASNSASYGIHVSGREKNTTNKYDGTVVIKNSTIDLDYLINKGAMTLDKATLTVKNGFAIGGRPASETESGADATATITLNNGSKVVVNNHNGMGLGYEAIGVMNINEGSTFECTQNFLVTAKGTMNVNGGVVTTDVKITNNGVINVSGESTLNIASFEGEEEIKFLDGATIKNSTIGGNVFVAGNVTFRGANTFAMLYDYGTLTDYYGTTAPMKWTVEEGASVTLTTAARYGLGYGDDVTVYGNIENALTTRETLTDADRSLFMHGLVAQESKGWNCDSKFTVKNAYVAIGSNNSFGNKSGNYGGAYTFNINNSVVDASRITFYEALSTTTFTIDGSDVKMGTFMTRDTDSKFVLKNSKVLSTTTSNGTDEGNYNKGELTLVNSSLTYSAEFKHEAGVINLDLNSLLTAPKLSGAGTINVDAADFVIGGEDVQVVTANMSGFTGTINVANNNYVIAEITETGVVIKEKELEGEGTADNPYELETLTELELFRNKVNAGDNHEGKYVKLSADVNLAATRSANNWEPIGTTANPFKGTFDGDGYTISNLVVEGENYVGLFGYADNATIKNVTIKNANVKGVECVGVIAGNVYSTSLIDNCHVKGNIKVEGQTSVGGIVGKYYTKVSNCSVIGDGVATSYVKGTYVESDFEGDNIGGIMGHGGENNRFTGNTVKNITISGTRKVGGVVGVTDKATQVVNCVVENVNIETTATAEYAASNKAKSGHGAIVGSYTTGGTAGLVADCVVKNVNFINEDSVIVSAGPITGGARGGSDSMLAPEGVTSSNNDIYMSTITGSNNEYLMNAVAKIGDVKYYALQDAFNAGGEVVVLTNIALTETVTVAKGQVVTLNLNGKTISAAITEQLTKSFAAIQNRGTLTVKDSATTRAAGRITVSYAGTTFGYGIGLYTISNEGGVLNIESGIVENTTTVSGSMYDAIDNNSTLGETVLNITGGEVRCEEYIGIRQFANSTTHENIVNVTGGKVVGGNTSIWMQNPGSNQPKATIAISGDANIEGRLLAGTSENFEFKVKGGTFTVDPQAFCAAGYTAKVNYDGTYTVKQTAGTLTRTLPEGWSWFSSYVDLYEGVEGDGLAVLENALGENGVQIKDNAGQAYVNYSNGRWRGSLATVSSETMYAIKTSAEHTLEITGEFYDINEYEVSLRNGWNYLSYPHYEAMPVVNALGFTPANGDAIKGKGVTAFYLNNSWIGAFSLTPGEGYMYYSNEAGKEFSYSTEETRSSVKSYVSESSEYWTVDASQYPSNMTMIATLDVEGADYEVAAFVDGEVRGSARPIYVDFLDQYIVVMTINGENVANVTFKYYDFNAGEEYDLNNVAVYSNNAILGSVDAPYALTRGTTGIGEATLSDINIYPNPTTTDREINLQATCDKVEVFNTLGVKVAEYQNVDTIDALETAGTYVIRVTLNGDVKHCRLVVK